MTVTQDLSFLTLITNASILVQLVMALLMLVSLTSWSYIFSKLFALPDVTRVWPGHDYHGQSVSSIGWEKRHNARIAHRSKQAFSALMAALDLPKPKLIDLAVPANQNLGLPHGA